MPQTTAVPAETMPTEQMRLPKQTRSAQIRAESINEEARTVDLVWSTGSEVLRWDWWTGKRYKETLSLDAAHVRMDRLNGGAPLLDTHNAYSLDGVLGVVEPGTAMVDGAEGRATVRFADTPEIEPIWRKVAQKIIRNVSVGYIVHKVEKTEADDEKVETWRAIDWEPMEISLVPVGADPGAGIRAEQPEFYPCAIIQRAAPAAPVQLSKEETMPDVTQKPAGGDLPETTTTDATRTQTVPVPKHATFTEVRTLFRSLGLPDADRDTMIERAEKEGLTFEKVRGMVLDDLAAKDESVETRSHVRITRDEVDSRRSLVENALMHRYDPKANKLEDGARQYMGLRLLELGTELARANGIDTRGMGLNERAGNVLGLNTRSGGLHSSSDFPFILANVANKTLRAGYDAAPRTFMPFCRQNTATDFKAMSRVQLGAAPSLNLVTEGGEFTYGTIGEGREQYTLGTYGRIVGITRQAIINDDLNAFTRVPQLMGNAAANLESNIVYAILTGNPAMADTIALFHADHGNFQGTGSAPDVTTIGAGMTAIGSQTGLDDDDVQYLNLQGRYLIGGWLTHTLRAQYTSPNFQPTAQSGVNPYATLIPITEARITDTSWFISADPAQVDTIEYAYLDGQEGVYTETRVGFEVDGVEIKARHDFAAKAIDWRGLYRNDGAGN